MLFKRLFRQPALGVQAARIAAVFQRQTPLVQLHDADHDIQAQPTAAVALIHAAKRLRQLPDHLFLDPRAIVDDLQQIAVVLRR